MARTLPGPLLIGLSVWCASGQITLAAPDAATVRLAAPASWWIAVAACVVAWLVPAWRRRPWLTAPAVLSTLPWWPIPLPAIAMIWTGPLAWLPILCACAGTIGSAPFAAPGRALGVHNPWRSTVLAGLLTLAACTGAAWGMATQAPSGDEPHYLMITQSLLKDHDLRVANNYEQGDSDAFYPGLAIHSLARGLNGEPYSAHAPGLAAVVLPAFAWFGYRGAEATLLMLAAIVGSLVWRIAWRASGDATAAWFAWAAIALSATFLCQSFTIFPDGPAALALAATLLVLLRFRQAPAGVGWRLLVGLSVVLAGLPWLHTRLVVLAAALGAAMVWLVLDDSSRPARSRIVRAVLFLIVPIVSAAGWLMYFQWIWGSPNPSAQYGATARAFDARYVPLGLLGLLLDEQFGVAAYAPVLLTAAAGLFFIGERATRRIAWIGSGAAAVYLIGVIGFWPMWWAGVPSTPARFAATVLPALAIPLAAVWTTGDGARRRMLLALLGISVAISALVVTVDHGELAFNVRDAEASWLLWLGPVVNLSRGWPSFFWALNDAIASQWAFARHALAWLGVFVAVWIGVRAAARRLHWSDRLWQAATIWWLLVSLTVATQLGWWITGAPALVPARSQLGLLTSAANRRFVARIAPLSVRRMSLINEQIAIGADEPGRHDGPVPLLVLASVPAGTYRLTLRTDRPAPQGELHVMIGDAPDPAQRFDVAQRNQQSFSLVLPAGARHLAIAASPSLDQLHGRLELVPLALAARALPLGAFARQYDRSTMFFCDYSVQVERDGFWVKGGHTAELAVARFDGSPPLSMAFRNGNSPNSVTLRMDDTDAMGAVAGGVRLDASLPPFEQRRIQVPIAAGGGLRLVITAASDLWIALGQ